MKEKLLFIVNPFSGTSKKNNFREVVELHIDKDRFDYEIQYTDAAGHAIAIAKKAAEMHTDLVVAVGGDGTINEVASSLVHTKSALGIIPAGSGNGFALHLGMSKDLVEAIHQINRGKCTLVDSCLLNEKFFINVAGVGFDAQVAYLTKHNKNRGFWNYLKTTLQIFSSYKPEEFRIEIDGKLIEGKYGAAVVANASKYGYVFTVAADAKLTDGVLDVILFKDAFVPRYFIEAYRFVNNTVHKSSLTETYQGKEIKITSANKAYYHLDGEGYEKSNDYTVKVVPNSIWVLVPADK